MTLPKKTFPSVFIILFNTLAFLLLNSCKDIVFNNPLDPDASAEAVQIIKVITTSLSGKGDICFDGEKFWKIENYGSLNAFDMESGTIIRTFTSYHVTAPSTSSSMCRGQCYWGALSSFVPLEYWTKSAFSLWKSLICVCVLRDAATSAPWIHVRGPFTD